MNNIEFKKTKYLLAKASKGNVFLKIKVER